MKRHWEVDELVEHWTLLPDEVAILANKTGANRLGFAMLLKFFQQMARFPESQDDIPKVAVVYVSKQVGVSPEQYLDYEWTGRTIIRHRTQIRQFWGFREATVEDASDMTNWLVQQVLGSEQDLEHLEALVQERFRELRVEPPTTARIDRLIRSAIRTYETNFFSGTLQKLSAETLAQIDALLNTNDTIDSGETTSEPTTRKTSAFHELKTDPGRVGLESVLTEVAKLQSLCQLALPFNLFIGVPAKILQTYKQRVAAEPPSELRSHPPEIRYSLVAAFCYLRNQEVTDGLIELLLQIVHRLGTKAETKVEKELLSEFKRVSGKTGLLFQLAEAALDKPEGIVKDVLYPVVGKQTLIDLVKELKSTGLAYRQKVYKIMRSSYSSYYRRMVPQILNVLEFRSNNDVHRPVIQALELLKKYAESSLRYYEADKEVPIDGVLRSGWREILLEKDSKGIERINRINYEISVLQALRERLREPTNLLRLKAELGWRWPTTSLLDILKETALRTEFTEHFKTVASREILDRVTLQKRLLLCLYGLGTNTGLKRLSAAAPGTLHQDLRYVQRRFINKDQLRDAIASVVNAIFRVRLVLSDFVV